MYIIYFSYIYIFYLIYPTSSPQTGLTSLQSLPSDTKALHLTFKTKHGSTILFYLGQLLSDSIAYVQATHYNLPTFTNQVRLNDSPLCTPHLNKSDCNFPHFLFDYPSLQTKRVILFSSLKSINIPFNLSSILNSNSEYVVNIIINFILKAGFTIFFLRIATFQLFVLTIIQYILQPKAYVTKMYVLQRKFYITCKEKVKVTHLNTYVPTQCYTICYTIHRGMIHLLIINEFKKVSLFVSMHICSSISKKFKFRL